MGTSPLDLMRAVLTHQFSKSLLSKNLMLFPCQEHDLLEGTLSQRYPKVGSEGGGSSCSRRDVTG